MASLTPCPRSDDERLFVQALMFTTFPDIEPPDILLAKDCKNAESVALPLALLPDCPSELSKFWKLCSSLLSAEVAEVAEDELASEAFNEAIKLCKSDCMSA